ncbi:MAG: hypothetical protein ACYTDX_03755, partial [Planctomycetota bacterium]
PAEPPAAIPERRELPKEPKKSIRKKMVDALNDYHSTPDDLNGIEPRQKAWNKFKNNYRLWVEKSDGNDPLRHVEFWEQLLMDGLPSANPKKRGVSRDTFTDESGNKTNWVVSVPSKYTKKSPPHPLLLTVVPKKADHKKLLKKVYGDLLDTHIVVAGYEEDALPSYNGRHLYWGIKYAETTFKIDPHRIILDGLGKGGAAVDKLAPDMAIFFSAVVMRTARTATPLVGNFGMHQVLVVQPDQAGPEIRTTVEALKQANEGVTVHTAGDEAATNTAVQEWIAALEPRPYRDQTLEYTWYGETVGDIQRNGYWFVVQEHVAAEEGILCSMRVRRDGSNNLVDIESSNVSRLMLLLNDSVLDLDHPVTVHVNGVRIGEYKVARQFGLIQTGLKIHRGYFLTGLLRITVPQEAWEMRKPDVKKDEPAEPEKPGDGDTGDTEPEKHPGDGEGSDGKTDETKESGEKEPAPSDSPPPAKDPAPEPAPGKDAPPATDPQKPDEGEKDGGKKDAPEKDGKG